MSRPGVEVSIQDLPSPKAAPTDVSTLFAVGYTYTGLPATPTLVTSLKRFTDIFGKRLNNSSMYDALDAFFSQGGSRAYVSRVVGPTPVNASAHIFDQAGSNVPGDVALDATAVSPGAWGNALNVEVKDGANPATFYLIVSHDVDGVLETSPDFGTRADAVTWASQKSKYIRLALGASNQIPRAQSPISFTGGNDDVGNATVTDVIVALTSLDQDLGPGQVIAPGFTNSDVHQALLNHCSSSRIANRRRAIIDLENTDVVADLVSAGEALQALSNSKLGAAWGGTWPVLQGLTPGTTRTAPPSGVIAGLIARSDRSNSPNVAAAGVNGIPTSQVADLSNEFNEDDRETLANASVNTFARVDGQIQNYGFRSLASIDDTVSWWQFSASRLLMAIQAKATAVAKRFVFAQVDGKRHMLAKLEGDVEGEALKPYYLAGSLFGETESEAFQVDAKSQTANPNTQLAQGIVRVLIAVRVSEFAELIQLEISNVPITNPLPG